jgi:ferrous iron transport protein A
MLLPITVAAWQSAGEWHTKSWLPIYSELQREDYHMTSLNMRGMKKNQAGIIRAINVGGELGRRIRDMGLVPGTEIKVLGRAPLFDPVALRVKGFTLTLRNNEADYIDVEVE